MDDKQYADLAIATWQECHGLLPKALKENLAPHKSDPKRLKKYGGALDIMKLRILPIRMRPTNFWNSVWCFYEIGIGNYDGALCLGGVQFLQFSSQKSCGDGKWLHPVLTILRDVQKKRSKDFNVQTSTAEAANCPAIQRWYYANPHKYFPVKVAAADLAWIIKQTLPRFEALAEDKTPAA